MYVNYGYDSTQMAARKLSFAMANLAYCLRDGAALCAAYYGGWCARISFVNGSVYTVASTTWHPGCGWPMPKAR